MAYDQHETGSAPGPVAAHKWVENIIQKMTAQVDPRQLVLGLAAYGYDWPVDSTGQHRHIDPTNVACFPKWSTFSRQWMVNGECLFLRCEGRR